MQHTLKKLNYSNKSTAGAIVSFWLNGTLLISARQQLDLLRRLYHEQLPFSKESQQIVKHIMKNSEPNLYGKTGWGIWQGKELGWVIGWIERVSSTQLRAQETGLDLVCRLLLEKTKPTPLTPSSSVTLL